MLIILSTLVFNSFPYHWFLTSPQTHIVFLRLPEPSLVFNVSVHCLHSFICDVSKYTLQFNRKGIIDFVKCAYLAYFKAMLGDQDKSRAPHIACKQCVEHLRQWTKKNRKSLRFGVPISWCQLQNHINDCYFCAVTTKGMNRRKILCFIQTANHH